MDLTALYPFLKTKSDVNKLIKILEGLQDGLFREDFDLSKTLSESTSHDLKEALEQTITSSKNSENQKDLRPAVASLLDLISKLPVVHVILAFYPTDEILKTIHNWFLENYKKLAILDISIDPKIIAGAVISFNGRANDYSLATRIEQLNQG